MFALGAAFRPVAQQRLEALDAQPAAAAMETPFPLPAEMPESPAGEPVLYKLGGRQRLPWGADLPTGPDRPLRRP